MFRSKKSSKKALVRLDLKQGLQNSHIKDLHETFKEEFTAKGVVESL